jgi:hypothetical protein
MASRTFIGMVTPHVDMAPGSSTTTCFAKAQLFEGTLFAVVLFWEFSRVLKENLDLQTSSKRIAECAKPIGVRVKVLR